MTTRRTLPFVLQIRLSADNHRYLEDVAAAQDVSMGGAVRAMCDRQLDLRHEPGAPTIRESYREADGLVLVGDEWVSIERVSSVEERDRVDA